MKRTILLLLTLSIATVSVAAQDSQIKRRCPGSTATASVAISKGGAITATPCSGQATIGSYELRSYLASDATFTNTATVANTPLSVTVATGGKYELSAYLITNRLTPSSSPVKVDLGGGTATLSNFAGLWIRSEPDGDTYPRLDPNGISTSRTAVFNGSSGMYSVLTFQGTIEVSAGGTFIVRGPQLTADPVASVLNRGSYLKLTKLN